MATIVISVTIVFFTPRLVPGDPLGALSLKLAQVGGNLGRQGADRGVHAALRSRQESGPSNTSPICASWRRATWATRSPSSRRPSATCSSRPFPWTVGLLLVTTVTSWLLGLDASAASSAGRAAVRRAPGAGAGGTGAVHHPVLHPGHHPGVPASAFLWPIFPLSGAYTRRVQPSSVTRLHRRCGAPRASAGAEHRARLARLVVPEHAQPDRVAQG